MAGAVMTALLMSATRESLSRVVEAAPEVSAIVRLTTLESGIKTNASLIRKQILSFATAAAAINVNTQGMKIENVRQLVDTTETAKNERYLLLQSVRY